MSSRLAFLAAGGEMGASMRARDWQRTPLGAPGQWPQALRTAVRLMLASPVPMCVLWGDDGLCLFNDAFAPFAGAGDPQAALGRPAREVWAEDWPALGPPLARLRDGTPAWTESRRVRVRRQGRWETARLACTWSPLDDDASPGGVGGVVAVAVEVPARDAGAASPDPRRPEQFSLLGQMPGLAAVLAGPSHVHEFANAAYAALAGGRPLIGTTVRDAFSAIDAASGYVEMLDRAYRQGEAGSLRAMPVPSADLAEARYVDLHGQPLRDEAGAITGVFVVGHEVTEQVRAERDLQFVIATLEARVQAALQMRHRVTGP